MKTITCLILSTTFLLSFGQAQDFPLNCHGVKISATDNGLKSQKATLVERGNYKYLINLFVEKDEFFANIYSESGVVFKKGDELIFMDSDGNRRAYTFIKKAEVSSPKLSKNIIKLEPADLKWFSILAIKTVYIKDNSTNKMFKFSINVDRQSQFKNLADCFLRVYTESN